MKHLEFFSYKCPRCQKTRNAAEVAAALSDDILIAETARRHGRRQTPHAGPGRPAGIRCPGCDAEMSSPELREHRLECVGKRLKDLKRERYNIRLLPKDPDPHPDFSIDKVSATEVEFHKLSSGILVPVELQKIAEITVNSADNIATIRLLGRVSWHDDIKRWRFTPTQVGRPRRFTGGGHL